MSGRVSPSTGRRYPLTMVCAVFRVARSTVYATPAARPAVTMGKRGPKTATSDAELVAAIRAVLAATPFHGEGYRKVRARLAHRGHAVGGKRVLPHASAPTPGPATPGATEWRPGARRHDHHDAAGRDVGHRGD